MKLCILPLCALLFSAHAADPERIVPSHISLHAQLSTVTAKAGDSYRDGAGGYDTKFTRSRSIVANVRNLGREPMTVALTVDWIGKPLDGRGSSPGISGKPSGLNDRFIFFHDRTLLTLAPGKDVNQVSTSGTIEATDLSLNLIGVRRISGYRIEGWVASVRDEKGALIAITASDTHLVDASRRGEIPIRKREER